MSDPEKLQISGIVLAIIFGIQQVLPENPEFGIGNINLSLHVWSEIAMIISGSSFLIFALSYGVEKSSFLKIPRSGELSDIAFSFGIFMSIVSAVLAISIQVTAYILTSISGLPLIQKIAGAVIIGVIGLVGILLNQIIDV